MLSDIVPQVQSAEEILATQHKRLADMAEDWLCAGATCFGLRAKGCLLAQWPEGEAETPADLAAPIFVDRRAIAELYVIGLDSPTAQARLVLEAEMISRLAQIEHELDEMTAALIDTQDHLLALINLSASTRSQLAVPDTLRTLARETTHLVKAEGAFALLIEPNQPPLIEHYPAAPLDEELLIALFRQVQADAHELVLPQDHSGIALGSDADIRNLMLEPIHIRGKVMAGLGLWNKAGRDFGSPDLKLVRAIAEQAGVQIENVLLYQETLVQAKLQHEMELAARIQLTLLPRSLPAVAGIDWYAHSRPALQVGGDFYDFLALPDRPAVFALGDVSGKGMSAALLMAMARTAIHSQAGFLAQPTPQEVLSRSSRDLYDDLLEVGMFVTVFAGEYEPRQGRLSYANAGHSPVVYCPAEGKARLLLADDPPMGVMPLDELTGQSLLLHTGDLLLVATDGFCEQRNPDGEMFGYDRLLAVTEELTRSAKPAKAVAQSLLTAVADFRAVQPQDDDQTLIVLRAVAP